MIKHDLIEQVGGIEKAREIVEGAPESNFPVKWGLSFKTYFRQVGYFVEQWFESKWQTRYSDSDWVDLETLSTAIEHHYYGRSEAEELAAYAELSQEKIEGGAMLVGDFSGARKIIDKQLESDQVTDIRNHISPNTKVVEL